MPTQIRAIRAQRRDFRTQANADWVDTIIVQRAGQGGVVAGANNAGNGALTIASVAPDTALGAHRVTITSAGSPAQFVVQDPDGTITGRSAVGIETDAGGLRFTLAAGSAPFASGDAFAIGVLPEPVSLTGITFALQARAAPSAATVQLAAYSDPPVSSDPATIAVDAVNGLVALTIPRLAMASDRFPIGAYVYDLLAIADGLTIPLAYGAIEHVEGVSRLP